MNAIRTRPASRPVSIAHLVFGLIFLGAAGLWAVGAATDADAPDLAVLAPAVLIAAGVVGLVAMVINARNARVRTATADINDTVAIDEEDPR